MGDEVEGLAGERDEVTTARTLARECDELAKTSATTMGRLARERTAARQINKAITERGGHRRTGKVIGQRFHARPLERRPLLERRLVLRLEGAREFADSVAVAADVSPVDRPRATNLAAPALASVPPADLRARGSRTRLMARPTDVASPGRREGSRIFACKLEPYQAELALLMKIPGFNRVTAASFIAETGGDMSVFPTSRHLAAWAGIAPGNNETGGKRRHAGTRKGNVHLVTTLVQAALGAVRTKGSYYKDRYWRLRTRRGAMRAWS
jgi:hypothetical protein